MAVGRPYDLAVVGAGIVGLACALAAARRGKRVIVVDRDAQANGASVRNFGFVTVTGQARGAMWQRARRSREVWTEVAREAAIPVLHQGLLMTARRPESVALIEAFLATEMGEGCELLDAAAAHRRQPGLEGPELLAALWSPHELRVESREAIPRLAAWLRDSLGVEFRRGVAVQSVETSHLETTGGPVRAEAIAVCPGDDLVSLFPDRIAAHGVTRCKLQMLRLADPGFRLVGAVMSDLGLERYDGYGALPEADPLRVRLRREQDLHLANGIHLIVVQSADGSLVVGDSHHYAATPDPFASEAVDGLILEEFAAVFGGAPPVLERWTGTYAWARDHKVLIDTPRPGVRLVMVTTGAGASTGFALGEEVVADLFGLGGGMNAAPRLDDFSLVIFDWAGTMVDFGCRAPVEALLTAFRRRGVRLEVAAARADMGRAKDAHVRALLERPDVAAAWRAAQGAAPDEAAVTRLMDDLGPLMRDAARQTATLIPGAARTVASLRLRGLKIASSTGYTREMMQPVLARAAEQGYSPDHLVCAGETPEGRPSPLMVYKACVELGVWPLSRVIKVDDAEAGVAEGRAAGCFTIGLAASGNGLGLSEADYLALAPDDRDRRLAPVRAALLAAGADRVVDTVADLPAIFGAD